MDSPFTVLFSTKSKQLTSPDDVTISLLPEYNRKKLPQPFDDDLEKCWTDRVAKNTTLYNGSKFRLDSIEKTGQQVHLNLGLTCYKDFQGTNLSEKCLELQSQGLTDHGHSQAYMSDALGVGALVETCDNHVMFLYRSSRCGEDVGLWDRPGGHPEPSVLVGKVPFEDIDFSQLDHDAVRTELFDSIRNEVISEVNIPGEHLSPPKLIGIHRSNVNGGKPNLEFFISCSLSASEVKQLYEKGNQSEAFESDAIKLIPTLEAINIHANNLELWTNMATGAKAVLTFYAMYKHRFN